MRSFPFQETEEVEQVEGPGDAARRGLGLEIYLEGVQSSCSLLSSLF